MALQAATPKWRHRSFFDEVDDLCPPFIHAEVAAPTRVNGQSAQGAVMHAAGDDPQRRLASGAWSYDIVTGEPSRHEFAMPWVAYVRGMDPAGNIHPLNTVTCQTAAECEGFDNVHLARKVRAGWLICERNWPNTLGLSGEDWGEHLRAEFLRRRAEHFAREQASAEGLETRAEQQMRQMMKEQREQNSEIVRAQAEISAEAVKAILAAQTGAASMHEVLDELAALKAEVASLRSKREARGG